MQFWVGAYGADMDGSASGIGVLRAGGDDALAGGQLSTAANAAITASASWLTAHPTLDVIYAAQESAGSVQAFRRTDEATLVPLGSPVGAGESVCHIAVAPGGGSLIASCWSGDGHIVRMGVDAEGRPSEPMIAAAARDPYGDTGRASHAHQAVFLSDGLVATTDMGLDLVRFWRVAGGGLRLVQEVILPRASGPRHMVWHPSGHLYVVTEFSCELFALAADAAGRWRIVAGTALSPAAMPGIDEAAELAASHDGGFLYAGVRGSNALATLRVRGGGEVIEPVALVESGVDWPRHHLIVRDTVLVAGQRSDEVVSLTLDARTGVPGRVRHRVGTPSPTCLLPSR